MAHCVSPHCAAQPAACIALIKFASFSKALSTDLKQNNSASSAYERVPDTSPQGAVCLCASAMSNSRSMLYGLTLRVQQPTVSASSSSFSWPALSASLSMK